MSQEGHAKLRSLGNAMSDYGGYMPEGGLKGQAPFMKAKDFSEQGDFGLKNAPVSKVIADNADPTWDRDFSGHRPPDRQPIAQYEVDQAIPEIGYEGGTTKLGPHYKGEEYQRRKAILDAIKAHEQAAAEGKMNPTDEFGFLYNGISREVVPDMLRGVNDPPSSVGAATNFNSAPLNAEQGINLGALSDVNATLGGGSDFSEARGNLSDLAPMPTSGFVTGRHSDVYVPHRLQEAQPFNDQEQFAAYLKQLLGNFGFGR
jgi:hypothetical protein